MQGSSDKVSIVIDTIPPIRKLDVKSSESSIDVFEEDAEIVSTDRGLLLEAETLSSFPTFLKDILSALIFGAVFLIPAALIRWNMGCLKPTGWLSVNIQDPVLSPTYLWSLLLAYGWTSGRIVVALVSFVVALCGYIAHLSGRHIFSGRGSAAVGLLVRSRDGIGIIVGASFTLKMARNSGLKVQGLDQVYVSAVILGILLTLKGILVSQIEARYFSNNLGKRTSGNRLALKFLGKLWDHFLPDYEVSAKHRGEVRHINPHISEEQVKLLGNNLYNAIISGSNSETILPEHLCPALDITDAIFFIDYIDFDGNGNLTMGEFEDGVKFIYNERKDLHHCYTGSDRMFAMLNILGTCFCISLYFMIAIGLMGLGITNQFLLQANFAVVANFFFEDEFSKAFQCLIYVFSQHAYDVGDVVHVHGHIYHVEKIGLWTSTMVDHENQVTYFSNLELSDCRIANFSRSPPQAIEFTAAVHSSTTREQLAKIEAKINEFIQANPRDYSADDCYVKNIAFVNSEAFIFQLQYTHRSRFTSSKVKSLRHRKFMERLHSILEETGTKVATYSLDLPRVTVTPH